MDAVNGNGSSQADYSGGSEADLSHPAMRSEECAEGMKDAVSSTLACVGAVVGGAVATVASGPLAPITGAISAFGVASICGVAGWDLASAKDKCTDAPELLPPQPGQDGVDEDAPLYVDGYC